MWRKRGLLTSRLYISRSLIAHWNWTFPGLKTGFIWSFEFCFRTPSTVHGPAKRIGETGTRASRTKQGSGWNGGAIWGSCWEIWTVCRRHLIQERFNEDTRERNFICRHIICWLSSYETRSVFSLNRRGVFSFWESYLFLRSFGENREFYLRQTADTLDADQVKLVGLFLLLHREYCL